MVTSPRNDNAPKVSDTYLMVVFDDRPNSLQIRGFVFPSRADANRYLDCCIADENFSPKFIEIYDQGELNEAVVYYSDDHVLHFYSTITEAHEMGQKGRGAVFVYATPYGELILETSYWKFDDAKTRSHARRGSMIRQASLGETVSCQESQCKMPDVPGRFLLSFRTHVNSRRGTV